MLPIIRFGTITRSQESHHSNSWGDSKGKFRQKIMTIEFRCPYCTATVRVGDEASGKIGRCPKCDTRVRIPSLPTLNQGDSKTDLPATPATQESSPTEGTPDSQPAPFPIDTQETSTEATSAFPDFSTSPAPQNPGQLPVVPVGDDPVTSKYLKRRKKKKTNYASWIAPLVFGGIFVAIAFIYYNRTKPSYVGELTAEKLNPNQSIQIELEGEAFNIDQKVFSQIVDELRKSPSAVHSNLVYLKFAAGANGMEMSLRPGVQADLVKVPVTNIDTIAKFYKEEFDTLDDARLAEIQAGLLSLAEEWVRASEGSKNETLPNYRNSVAYNAFVKGLGRIVYAQVDNAIYPCVHEDGTGSLYFLVPIGTEEFTIRERSELDETPVFPSELSIQVTIERPKLGTSELVPVEPDAESIPIAEPDSETEMEGEDTEEEMSPPSEKMMKN